ncbi:hypothetical protein A7U60_g5002 [Sanghuangporus baumii]|uniref:Uncharacterized protein n=1 Tax=Sanghuangporus baumii TaxID=108892 RepID=A0A9Q5HXK3_SANBA|nr:hypothetical protein A7U60_g5002 [Sanghuangporus baumii]
MSPSEFFLRMQCGITGGFVPPSPSAVHTLSKASEQTHVLVASAVRVDGGKSLSDADPKTLDVSGTSSTELALVDELHSILTSIPTESPPGSEDIYGLDTSIAWQSNDIIWVNGSPSGCVRGKSTVQPSEDEKAKFRRAVEVITELVAKAE